MNISENINKWLNKVRDRSHKVLVGFALVCGMAVGCGTDNSQKNSEKTPENKVVKVDNPIRRAKYATDTISKTSSRALLYYVKGKIIRNYVDKDNMYKLDLPLFSHEDWHAYVDEINWRYSFKYTPLEYYKLCIHNEITANIAALLTTRYQYIAAKDKKEFAKKYKGKNFGFYFDAVGKGKINPENSDAQALEKEYALIANGMQERWMQKLYKWYTPSFNRMLRQYIELYGFVDESKKNYNYIMKRMYTIRGVDFSKYLKYDVLPSDEKVAIAECLRNIKTMRDGGADVFNYVNNDYSLLGKAGIEKQNEAFQHLLIAAKLKHILRDKTEAELRNNPQKVDMYYRQILYKFKKDKTFKEYVEKFPVINMSGLINVPSEAEYEKVISQMYNFKGVDLRVYIQDFKSSSVPVKNKDIPDFKEAAFDWIIPIEIQADEAEKKLTEQDNTSTENTKSDYAQKHAKRRISDWQYIDVPNYREPILISSSPKDKEAIMKVIHDFDNIPQVLKECDTEAQKKYYENLNKNKIKSLSKSQRTQNRNMMKRNQNYNR